MPTVYSFTTTSFMPVSENWPCMDIGEGQMPNILLFPGVTVSRGAPWITFDGDNDLVMKSDDGIATIISVALNISQKFTFETTFKPCALPTNLNDLAKSRFFIAMFDDQDNAGGVLISKGGLAIVSAFGNSVLPIAGSQNIFVEGDEYYTMRMVVDGSTNVMDLYIMRTLELEITGHVLRYTTGAPVTPATVSDSVRIELVGQPAALSQGNFSTLRCNCDGLNIPNKRPVADTGDDQTAVIGSVIEMDGTDSYDPEGENLTYLWSVVSMPDGSSYKTKGLGGFTQDDGDGDGFTNIFEDSVIIPPVGGTGPWSLLNCPSLQPNDVLIVDDKQYIVSDTDWVVGSSGLYERGGGFDPNKLKCEYDNIPDNLSGKVWTVFHQSTFWADRTAPQPTFVPDLSGLYDLQLVVNDGVLDSLPAAGLVNIAETNVPFGYVPDVNFIWDYLSDVWDLYDDRDPITTCWSGFAQIASNLLLTAWQYDYGKSLVDIQRQFQRRWLSYDPLFEEPWYDRDETITRIVRGRLLKDVTGGKVFAGTGETLIISKDGTSYTITFAGIYTPQQIVNEINKELKDPASTEQPAQILTEGGVDYLSLEYDGLLIVHKEGTANSTLGYSTVVDEQNDLFGDVGTANLTAFEHADPLTDLTSLDVAKNDLLILGGAGYEILKVATVNGLTLKQQAISYSGSWLISSYVESQNTSFTDELVSEGDILILEMRGSETSETEEVLCRVTGARNKRVGFDPRPLLERVAGKLSDYEVTFRGVRRINAIPVNTLVMRIPRLQEVILDPPNVLTLNAEYTLEINEAGIQSIVFESGLFSFDTPPPDKLWAEQTFFNNSQMIENNFGKAVDFTAEKCAGLTENLDYLSAVSGLWYAFFNGPSLYNVRLGTQILLGLPFAEVAGTIDDISLKHNASQIRMLIKDAVDPIVVRSYFIPRNVTWEEDGESMVAINPATDTEYKVGDEITQFAPLAKGVEISDWVKDPTWWEGYNNQGVFLEVKKFFHFLIMADIDVFSITNLIFAIDFVKKIKPHYTYPMWVVLKRLPPDHINVTDAMTMKGYLHLADDPACQGSEGTGGSYRFDDTDESGNPNWAFDGDPLGGSTRPEFLYDKRRLCPDELLRGIMSAHHAGGLFPYDWIWAFDDGGGEDDPPLSGPLGAAPPSGGPYGALVGVIKFDTPYAAGYYTRGKVLSENKIL